MYCKYMYIHDALKKQKVYKLTSLAFACTNQKGVG